jgi:predicted NAD/FAD-binding protein
VAIVGSGISGLAAAHTLTGLAELTLFEPVTTSAATPTRWT